MERLTNSIFGVRLSWWGQACVIDAFVAIFIKIQPVVKSIEPEKKQALIPHSLTPLTHELNKKASFKMKSES